MFCLTRFFWFMTLNFFLAQGTLLANGLGVQVFLPTMHFSEESIEFGEKYSYKMDHKGRFVWMPGLKLFYDQSLKNSRLHISWIRFASSISKDCMDRLSFVFHFGPRWQIHYNKSWSFSLGIGPALWLRKTWEIFPFYKPDSRLKRNPPFFPGYEYLWFPVAGDIDIEWEVTRQWSFIYSFIPAYPYVFSQTAGFRRVL